MVIVNIFVSSVAVLHARDQKNVGQMFATTALPSEPQSAKLQNCAYDRASTSNASLLFVCMIIGAIVEDYVSLCTCEEICRGFIPKDSLQVVIRRKCEPACRNSAQDVSFETPWSFKISKNPQNT